MAETVHSIFYFSLARWQITSTEKLKASANARHSHQACFPKDMSNITRQKRLTITVSAFFSEKYFFSIGEAEEINFFIANKGKFRENHFLYFSTIPSY
jgi:hypothetical protein